MAKQIESVEELQDWNAYREFLKEHLKKLDGEEPAYITKKKLDFQIDGKPYKGYAFLAGKKAKMSVQKCKAGGVQWHQGLCTLEGKTIHISGISEPKFVKEVAKTFLKLKLGWKIASPGGGGAGNEEEEESMQARTDPAKGADSGASPGEQAALKQIKSSLSERIKTVVKAGGTNGRAILELVKQASTREKSGDFAGARAAFEEIRPLLDAEKQELARQAQKIEKAVQIWNKTEEAATKELRKLQKAIMALNDPRGTPVIRGLEGILRNLDRIDDEAREAAQAAEQGDSKAFAAAREDFMKKVRAILDHVSQDQLIKDADSNPAVAIKIEETLSKSLNALMKAV